MHEQQTHQPFMRRHRKIKMAAPGLKPGYTAGLHTCRQYTVSTDREMCGCAPGQVAHMPESASDRCLCAAMPAGTVHFISALTAGVLTALYTPDVIKHYLQCMNRPSPSRITTPATSPITKVPKAETQRDGIRPVTPAGAGVGVCVGADVGA